MKRLICKHSSPSVARNIIKRLIRVAEWVDVDINDPDLVQNITDLMSSGGQMQILYNSEWKTISPYGWNSSKEGNILIMCYKDTGEIRSYRLDRVEGVQLDSNSLSFNDTPEEPIFEDSNQPETTFELPPDLDEGLTNVDDQQGQELPFDDALDALEEDYTPEPEMSFEDNGENEVEIFEEEPTKELEKETV